MDRTMNDSMAAEWRAPLSRYLQRMIKDEAKAEDLAHETLLRFHDKADTVPGDRRRAWLYRVARNLAIDHLRRKKLEPGATVPDVLPDDASRCDPSLIVERKEEKDMLLHEMEKLPPRQREVLRLKFQEGLKYDEIAEATGQTRSTVGWLLHKAITTLRKELPDPAV